jgi:hypothetical protein
MAIQARANSSPVMRPSALTGLVVMAALDRSILESLQLLEKENGARIRIEL